MLRQISHLVFVVSARILGSIEIKWGSALNEAIVVSFSITKAQKSSSYNFLLVGIKSTAYFLNSIYLDPYFPLSSQLFTNTVVIKDKGVELCHYLNCINSLSSYLGLMYQR